MKLKLYGFNYYIFVRANNCELLDCSAKQTEYKMKLLQFKESVIYSMCNLDEDFNLSNMPNANANKVGHTLHELNRGPIKYSNSGQCSRRTR